MQDAWLSGRVLSSHSQNADFTNSLCLCLCHFVFFFCICISYRHTQDTQPQIEIEGKNLSESTL